MSAKDKSSIKAFFQTNDKPTQSQFVDLIDSYVDSAGPIGTIEAAASAGATGFAFVSGFHGEVLSGANALAFMGATVVTTAQASAATQNVIDALVATTAQAVAGTDNTTLMTPVLVKNAAAALASSELVLLGTATASASSTLNFTSLIDATVYTKYLFVFRDLLQSGTASVQVKFSINNGSDYTAAINWQKEQYDLGTANVPTRTGGTTPMLIQTSNANENNSGFAFLTTTASSGVLWEGTLTDGDGVLCKSHATSIAGALNAIQFLPSSGNFTSGTVKLYGIKQT